MRQGDFEYPPLSPHKKTLGIVVYQEQFLLVFIPILMDKISNEEKP